MKKLVSLILTVLMVCTVVSAFTQPAFASSELSGPQGEDPRPAAGTPDPEIPNPQQHSITHEEPTPPFPYLPDHQGAGDFMDIVPDSSGNITIYAEGNYRISQSCTLKNLNVNSFFVNLCIWRDTTVKVTESFNCEGFIAVYGKLDLSECKKTSGLDGVDFELGTLIEPPTGFTLSNGSLWIIIAGAVVIIGGIVAIIVVTKKKKKPVLAEGTENKDEE